MKFSIVFVLLTVLQTSWCQNLECGGNPLPGCLQQCLFPPVVEVLGRTVRCEQEYPFSGCFIAIPNLACTNMSVEPSDLVSNSQTDAIALSRAMLFQIFPDAFLDTTSYVPVALNNWTLAFTSNYEWIEDFSSEFILELVFPYTNESAIQHNFEFISNDKAKNIEIKSDK